MIGDKIKKRRLELGLTQEELAKKLGYKHKSSINKIELNQNDIRQSKVAAFAVALDTSVAYLMGWDEDAENELLSLFRNLNEDGRDAVIRYVELLDRSGEYKKHDNISRSEKAV